MPPFQYDQYRNPFVGNMVDLIQRPGEIRARAAELAGQANARAVEQSGQAWAGAAQNIGQTVAAIPGQIQGMKKAALDAEHQRASIDDMKAQQAQRQAAAQKAQTIDAQNKYIDQVMASALVTDPATGVSTFKRDQAEQGLIKGGLGHLYPSLAETFDKLDASAEKRAAEGRSMLAHSLIGVEQAGFTQPAALSAVAYLKKNNLVTDDQIQPVLAAMADDPSPEHIKTLVTNLGQTVPEYQALKATTAKQSADLAKTQAETGKITAETTGTLPATPAQQETARHNAEMERIANLTAGRQEAAQQETARHNRATEAQAAATNDAAPVLTPDAIKLTARQFAMTGQLPPMGMGKQGAKVRTDIINAAAKEYANLDLPSQVAAYKANQQSLTHTQGTLDNLTAFEKAAGKNIDTFIDLTKNLPDTGVPWLNTPLRALDDKLVGNQYLPAINAARQIASREVARVVNDPGLKGQLTDSARQGVESMLSGDITIAQLKQVLPVLKNDMANVHTSLSDQLAAIQQRIATKPGETTTPSSAPVRMKAPNGQVSTVPADQVEHYKSLGAVVVP